MAVGPLDFFERAIPPRTIDADRPDRHAVGPGVGNDLSRRVEPHRLRIDEGGTEHIRIVAFDIGRGVSDESK